MSKHEGDIIAEYKDGGYGILIKCASCNHMQFHLEKISVQDFLAEWDEHTKYKIPMILRKGYDAS